MTDSSCLTPAQLAALAEGRLPAPERDRATHHLSTCEWCRDELADLTRFVAEQAPAPRAAIYWGRRTWVGLAAAAAMVLTTWAGYRTWNTPQRQADGVLADLASSLPARSTQARVHGEFVWGPPPATTRGEEAKTASLAAEQALLTLRQLATSHPSAHTLAAVGVARLVTGDLSGALESLEAATERPDADASTWANLSAVHVEYWRRSRAPVDASSALDAAERALRLNANDAVARFNQALAVEALGLRAQAIDRWKAYLTLDATSSWADEAREHLTRLEKEPPPTAAAMPAPFVIPASISGAARTCAQEALDLLLQSRATFDANQLAQAEQLARTAAERLRCARLPVADAHAQLAWTMFFQNRSTEAIELSESVMREPRLALVNRGRMEYIRGLANLRQGRYLEANAGYDRAIADLTRAGDREYAVAATALRAELARYFTDRAAAWADMAPAFAAVPTLGARRRHLAFNNAIENANWFGQVGAASFLADALVNMNGEDPDPVIAIAAHVQRVKARVALRDSAQAEASLQRASTNLAKIRDASLRAQYAIEVDALTAQVMAQVNPEQALQAYDRILQDFTVTERPLRRAAALLARGRLHAAQGRSTEAERDWNEGLVLFEDPRPELRDAQWRVDSRDQLWGLYRELIRVNQHDPRGALEFVERSRGRALLDARARGDMVAPLSGTALHDWLPADTVVLAYTQLDDHLLRWTVTRDHVQLDQVPVPATDLRNEVDQFVTDVAQGRQGQGAQLATWLLPPTLESSRTPRLVVLPDGPLNRVPFAALPIPGGTRLVIDEFLPQVSPSLTMLKQAARGRIVPERALLVAAGEPQPREGLSALPGVRAEVQALREQHRSATVLMDTSASARAVLAALPSADLFHFAGHAVTDSVAPSRSRLLLSSTESASTLTFADLRSVRLPAGATMILSACDGARGRVFIGEGAVGLPFVFLANGASSVVAALWQIDDAAPVSFWVDVHQRLNAGVAPAQALAESQRRSRQAGVSSAVWAAFTTIGGLVTS